MGVRSRKKARNKSRYRIASKRRKASAQKKINPVINCSAVKSAWDSSKPASTNVSNMGLVYNLNKIGLSDSKSTRQTLLSGKFKKKKQGISKTAVQQLEEQASKEAQLEKPGVRLTNAQVVYATTMLDKYGDDYKNSCHDVEPVPVSSPSSDVNELEVATEGNSMLDISYPLHVSRSSTPLPTNSTTTNVAPSRPTQKKCRTAMSDDVLMTINEHFKKPREQKIEDKHDVFGKNVAHKLRGLDNLQRIMAEKIINDALFEAEMGNLTHHHKLLPVPVTNTQFPIQHNVFPQPSATPRTVPHTMPHTSLHLPSLSSTMDPLAQAISVLNEIP